MADFSQSVRSAMMAGFLAEFGSGAELLCYSGSKPSAGAVPSGVLQATVPLADPVGVLTDSTLVFTPADGVRVASDPITWCRIVNGDGDWVVDGTASLAVGAGDFRFDTLEGIAGATVELTSGSFVL